MPTPDPFVSRKSSDIFIEENSPDISLFTQQEIGPVLYSENSVDKVDSQSIEIPLNLHDPNQATTSKLNNKSNSSPFRLISERIDSQVPEKRKILHEYYSLLAKKYKPTNTSNETFNHTNATSSNNWKALLYRVYQHLPNNVPVSLLQDIPSQYEKNPKMRDFIKLVPVYFWNTLFYEIPNQKTNNSTNLQPNLHHDPLSLNENKPAALSNVWWSFFLPNKNNKTNTISKSQELVFQLVSQSFSSNKLESSKFRILVDILGTLI
ncbi:hypothetical protein BB560_005176 [Smittium megazygosporum]|uniref:Uncharacterized protein n=1 Tax=Smittium megazygosporum TaxID=133381 RepID=A0A2T9Z768_9FUNG|nr:hypothetical protein BB560_005176 [Smittium megazygosporum]